MTDNKNDAAPPRPPEVTHHRLSGRDDFHYTATAAWEVLRDKDEKPCAEMFHVSYTRDVGEPGQTDTKRPVTFVFNGGPGASSAYLHVGALGPRRVSFNADGTMPPPPAALVDNAETWLDFTDLVFVDPIGTGFSRVVQDSDRWKEDDKAKPAKPDDAKKKEFWQVRRDLESLGELMRQYLSQHSRWASPVFIAGESYGGFRVARLTRVLHEEFGIGLNGAILISPALEFALLAGTDYDALHWIDVFPTMAGAAFRHGKATTDHGSLEQHLKAAQSFACRELLPALAMGAAMPEAERHEIYGRAAALIGLDPKLVSLSEGRISRNRFARSLLRDQRQYVGLYDAAVAVVDPFPDRDSFEGPDPTLAGIGRMFTGAINTHLRDTLNIEETEREYRLLNYDVFTSWKFEGSNSMGQGAVSATDHLRYGMAINKDMKVFITHGLYDMVTPYFTSDRLVDGMRLDKTLAENLTVQHFEGGHMFYTWDESRVAFHRAMASFYDDAA